MNETSIKRPTDEHCCACCRSEDENALLLALIDAAMQTTSINDTIPTEYREEANEISKTARAFLAAWWERKRPALEMPRL